MKINKLNESSLIEKKKLQLRNATIKRPMGWHSQLSPGGSSEVGGCCESVEESLNEDNNNIEFHVQIGNWINQTPFSSFDEALQHCRKWKGVAIVRCTRGNKGNGPFVTVWEIWDAVDWDNINIDGGIKENLIYNAQKELTEKKISKKKNAINGGDPEYNRQMFNHMNGSGDMPKPPKGSGKLIGGSSSDGTIGAVSASNASGVGTSASGGMGEALEKHMNRKELEEARNYIAQCCNLPSSFIQIYPDGRFQIHNVSEMDAQRIKSNLMGDGRISNVFSSSGSYDFGHLNHMMQPTQKQNISGKFE